MQPLGTQGQYFAKIERFLDLAADLVKVLDIAVQHLVAIFKDLFLFADFLMKNIKLRSPLMQLVAVLADHVAEHRKDHGGAAPHVAVHGKMFAGHHDITYDLLKEVPPGIIIKKQPDRDPADRGGNAKQKSVDRKQS